MARNRVRRTAQESRLLILQAAEQLLVEGGPLAVQVRAVGVRVGMTDAGIYHHFGSRQDLLVALLRHGGRQLRTAIEQAVSIWVDDQADLGSLIETIAAVYRDGYGALAIALDQAGWRDPGSGLLEPVVQALHAARNKDRSEPRPIEDTRLAVAALHQALATDPVYGPAFRRSAGITGKAAEKPQPQLTWWATMLANALGLKLRDSSMDTFTVVKLGVTE